MATFTRSDDLHGAEFVVIGLILLVLGMAGRTIGGRKHYY